MKWIKEITLEDIFQFESEVYKALLNQYEKCIEVIVYRVDYEIKENMIKVLNCDLHLAIKSIMTLLNEKNDILKEEFEKEEKHPIIYLNKNSWITFKLAFKSLKERVIAYEK